MQLDWTTFILEIVNFLVLLWILKRFFFRPVREAIARRQASVAATLEQAQGHAAEADRLKQQYEARMQDWDKEREAARAQLGDELAQERQRRLAELQQALADERARDRVLQERRRQEQSRALADQAADQAASFASRVLERLTGPALDARIADVVAEDLAALPQDRRTALAAAVQGGATAEICSAHSLPAATVKMLCDALQKQVGSVPRIVERVDPALRGGIRITLGPWALEATLAHELAFFRQGLDDEG